MHPHPHSRSLMLFGHLCLDAAAALLAVKMLGRNPAGSRAISTPEHLSVLLTLSTNLRLVTPDVSNEALRCVANTLLLNDAARATWISKEVKGGEAVIDKLEVRPCLCSHRLVRFSSYHPTIDFLSTYVI